MLNTDTNKIRDEIKKINKYIKENDLESLMVANRMLYLKKMTSHFSDFCRKYPILFKKIVLKEDLHFLEKFLNKIEKIHNGASKDSIERDLGYELADTYFPPELKEKMRK